MLVLYNYNYYCISRYVITSFVSYVPQSLLFTAQTFNHMDCTEINC